MKTISVIDAFGNAPPRSAAVLCLRRPGNTTDLILVEWFTWLNLKRNPMISYSMSRRAPLGLDIEEGAPLALAFPPKEEALKYRDGVRGGLNKTLPEGISLVYVDGLAVQVPNGSEVVLQCKLAGTYNYPFKPVRIFNCNLEKALGERRSAN